ncbi:uncharacterized protein LOC125877301 [Solanum stenotomum]|uniref:uncharacterized protein LOC125877301 n=1 Tax=Solanum stenotomum TaxID=172797 RepID=UPI0020D1CDF2|nr:uncharacterized protein LOC125877301 [Solanum stenotomum]
MSGESVKKPWTDLFATNRLATRGMNLNYIPPVIVDGQKVVEILPEDVVQDDEKWAPSIVVYVVGTTPSIGAMERFIMGQGTFSTKHIILYHVDGYFVVRFANEEERDMALCSGPHHLLRRHVIMKPWVPEFNFKEEILTTIPLWIKLPNLPLNYWNSVVLSKICSCLGKPLYADECTTQISRISFARILVEVDKCLQVGHSYVEKLEAPIQFQKKNQGQGHRKEWIPTTNKEQGYDKKQVESNQQEKSTHEKDETSRGQGEWHTVTHIASIRRESRNIQDSRGGQRTLPGVMIHEEGQMSGEGSGGMDMTSIQPSIHDSDMECEGF